MRRFDERPFETTPMAAMLSVASTALFPQFLGSRAKCRRHEQTHAVSTTLEGSGFAHFIRNSSLR